MLDGHKPYFRGGRKAPGRDYSRSSRDVLLEAFVKRNMTTAQGAEIAGRDWNTIRKLFNRMRDERVIMIVDWVINPRGPHTAVYGLRVSEDEKEAKNPPRQSDKERSTRYQRRKHGRLPMAVRRISDPVMRALVAPRRRDSKLAG